MVNDHDMYVVFFNDRFKKCLIKYNKRVLYIF